MTETGIQPSSEELELLNDIYPCSKNMVNQFLTYGKLLRHWQAKTNLVAPSTLEQFWRRHLADSLQVFALKPGCSHWTDIGSGGGFPGMVLAIAVSQSGGDDANVHLVESNRKKCAFLRKVVQETKAAAEVHAIRIESASKQLQDCQIITSRALASLDNLLELAGRYICGNRIALFQKGRDYSREIADCNGKWKFDLIVHESRIDAESVILEISNVSRTG